MERSYTVFSQTLLSHSKSLVCLFCLFTLSFHFFPTFSLMVFTSREWGITNFPKSPVRKFRLTLRNAS